MGNTRYDGSGGTGGMGCSYKRCLEFTLPNSLVVLIDVRPESGIVGINRDGATCDSGKFHLGHESEGKKLFSYLGNSLDLLASCQIFRLPDWAADFDQLVYKHM